MSEKKIQQSAGIYISNDDNHVIGKIIPDKCLVEDGSGQQYVISGSIIDKDFAVIEHVVLIAMYKVPTDRELDIIEKISKSHIYGIDILNVSESEWDLVGMKRGYSKLPVMTELISTAFYSFNVKGSKSVYEREVEEILKELNKKE